MVKQTTTMVGDRIGDFINQLKNASSVNKTTVTVSHTKVLQAVAEVLKKSGYLSDYEKGGKDVSKSLTVEIATPITYAARVSKPSKRVYAKSGQAPVGKGGQGITVLSTPKGIMTSEDARTQHVGGEVLFTLI